MIIDVRKFGSSVDCLFHCAMVGGATTLSACQMLCPKYYSCDTVAKANDELCYACEIQAVMLRPATSPKADYEVESIKQNGDEIFNVNSTFTRTIHWRGLFDDFKEDFGNFLSCQHEDFVIPSGNSNASWEVLWEIYQNLQDQNVAAWDTFEDVLNEARKEFGCFECAECGVKLLGSLPEADRDGNCYCDKCARMFTDFCDCCCERFSKTDLLYNGDNVHCHRCADD